MPTRAIEAHSPHGSSSFCDDHPSSLLSCSRRDVVCRFFNRCAGPWGRALFVESHLKIMYSRKRASERWNATREARLRLRPLEEFMRSHALRFDAAAPANVHIEIVCRSFLDQTLTEQARAQLSDAECWGVGLAVCDICFFLGNAVGEPTVWRTAALRVIGLGLRPHCRWRDSAVLAANIVRHFEASRLPRWASSGVSLLNGVWLAAATCRLRIGFNEYDAVIPQSEAPFFSVAAAEVAEVTSVVAPGILRWRQRAQRSQGAPRGHFNAIRQ